MFVQLAYCILWCFVVYYYQSRGEARDSTELRKKILKKFQKPLDKQHKVCYNRLVKEDRESEA